MYNKTFVDHVHWTTCVFLDSRTKLFPSAWRSHVIVWSLDLMKHVTLEPSQQMNVYRFIRSINHQQNMFRINRITYESEWHENYYKRRWVTWELLQMRVSDMRIITCESKWFENYNIWKWYKNYMYIWKWVMWELLHVWKWVIWELVHMKLSDMRIITLFHHEIQF